MQKPYVVAIGDCGIDRYYNCTRWPQLGEQFGVAPAATYVGGLVANASRTIATYGIPTYFFGATPNDGDGTYVVENMKAAGLNMSLHRMIEGEPLSVCWIFTVPSGERTIIYAEREVTPLELSEEQQQAIFGAEYVYTTLGGMLRYSNTKEVFTKARELGVKIACDFEAYSGGREEDLVNFVDIVLINDHDFALLSKGADETEFVNKLLDNGAQTVVITKGVQGASAYTKQETVHCSSYKVDVVDTTGAGDTFNSSFVSCMLWGKSLQEACEFASAAAGRAVTQLGPSGGVTPVENVLEFKATHELR